MLLYECYWSEINNYLLTYFLTNSHYFWNCLQDALSKVFLDLPDDQVCGSLGVEDGGGHHHLHIGPPAPHRVRVHLAHVPPAVRLLYSGGGGGGQLHVPH